MIEEGIQKIDDHEAEMLAEEQRLLAEAEARQLEEDKQQELLDEEAE